MRLLPATLCWRLPRSLSTPTSAALLTRPLSFTGWDFRNWWPLNASQDPSTPTLTPSNPER